MRNAFLNTTFSQTSHFPFFHLFPPPLLYWFNDHGYHWNEKTCIHSMVNLLWKTFYGKHIMVKVHRTTREVVNFGILEGLAGAGVELGYDTI